jgi:hypothetical protein
MKNILVTGVGGPTPRSFVRAIKWFGGAEKDSYNFIGADANPLAYGLYEKELFSKSFVVPRASDAAYWPAINKLIAENDIHAAVILPEVEVIEWAQNAKKKLEHPIKTHLPDYALANELVNKYRLHEHLKGTTYIPHFYRINPKDFSYADISKAVGTTFWVRATEGSSGLGSLKIENEHSLAQWIAINGNVSEFIATEFLPGRNMACKLLYFNGKLVSTACAERVYYIMSKVAPSGITGNTSFGRLLNEPGLVEISIDTVNKIAATTGSVLNGIYTVDYKEAADGSPKITEINIRHVAFTSSIAAGGANLPYDTLTNMFADSISDATNHYTFPQPLIFVRDVDGYPIVMPEADLLKMS